MTGSTRRLIALKIILYAYGWMIQLQAVSQSASTCSILAERYCVVTSATPSHNNSSFDDSNYHNSTIFITGVEKQIR